MEVHVTASKNVVVEVPLSSIKTLAAIQSRLYANGARFEMETVTIRGVPTRSWKNLPPNLPALARAVRAEHAERTFIICADDRITYEAWFRAVSVLAKEFQHRGIAKGDRVALAMRNLSEWPVAFFAAAACGAIVVPLNAWWTASELKYGLIHSGAKALVCDAERWERIRPSLADLPGLDHIFVTRGKELPARTTALESLIGTPSAYRKLPSVDLPKRNLNRDDDATIFYTSGTSGVPKGAVGSHRNILTSMFSTDYARQRMQLLRGEEPSPVEPGIGLMVVPLFHVTACNAMLMSTLAAGGALVFMHKWDATKALELIERERVSYAVGVPTIAWQLVEHPDRLKYDLSSLTAVSCGGAPAASELARRIKSDLGAVPAFGWGMTETSAGVTVHAGEEYLQRPDSCGPPLPISDLKIMSEDGLLEAAAENTGELWARGPQTVRGYWNDPEETARTFVGGWVRTGDLARLDNDGYCYIVDRAKDVIIRGGENIYSIEVENVLYEHPAVIDAALVGVPHRTLGEEPAAVVHLAPGLKASEVELQTWVRERLAAFKTPVRVLSSAETLPRNANGKILRNELRLWFERNAASRS